MELHLQQAGPNGRAIIERDLGALSPSYTREYGLVVDRAEGAEVWDVDGRRYIDFMAGIGVLNVGHRHPRVVEAVKEQIDKFWHICLSDFYYPNAVELAEKLQATAPMSDETRVFFSNSGTEAVEAAIKLAMYKTGRTRFVGFLGGFHGRTLGALSFTASKAVQRANYLSGVKVYHVPYPNPYRPVIVQQPGELYGDAVLNFLEEQLFRTTIAPHDVAAVMIEPIQGEGGYIVPATHFMPRLRELCDRYGILLIVDEVQSGVGRTGKWWATEHEEVEPDIVCFAKGIASGLPLGGIIARKEVMDWKPGAHGSTFGGNPVAIAAAVATLTTIEQEGLLNQAAQTGQFIQDALAEMESRHPSIGEVRGRGLMIGAEFVKNRESKERAVELRNHVIHSAFQKGLLLLPCGTNTIRFIPPLNISRGLVEEGLHILETAVTEAEARYL
ncbi:MAG: acetyl ornithine aminotransferase family protein [Chloroflexi bacterium]|nr:acetyl ornithine aminotransferase family protein [Ardenticatenaceae bacterium]MBL1126914.1 acetyl ornithine aminotransferase family protein [Chloroflexota bacterium]NOG32970.1 acetyl ornithine aminotransferase family protein [Chloroflexota bacterium]GIK54731.1 MAG: acetylornithine aminotransferase [Chloroflexota bacterium]